MKGWIKALGVAAAAGGLSVVPAGVSEARTRVDSYCTPTGDYCHGIFRTPRGAYYFDFDTFAFRGSLQICVAKQTRVCRVRPLVAVGRGLYRARIYWATNYPNQGLGRYAVSWSAQGKQIGRTLYFTRSAAAGCGIVNFKPRPDYEGSVRILRVSGTSCVTARQVVRACGYQNSVASWSVAGNAIQFTMTSGSRRIVVRGVAGGAPRCAPDSP